MLLLVYGVRVSVAQILRGNLNMMFFHRVENCFVDDQAKPKQSLYERLVNTLLFALLSL